MIPSSTIINYTNGEECCIELQQCEEPLLCNEQHNHQLNQQYQQQQQQQQVITTDGTGPMVMWTSSSSSSTPVPELVLLSSCLSSTLSKESSLSLSSAVIAEAAAAASEAAAPEAEATTIPSTTASSCSSSTSSVMSSGASTQQRPLHQSFPQSNVPDKNSTLPSSSALVVMDFLAAHHDRKRCNSSTTNDTNAKTMVSSQLNGIIGFGMDLFHCAASGIKGVTNKTSSTSSSLSSDNASRYGSFNTFVHQHTYRQNDQTATTTISEEEIGIEYNEEMTLWQDYKLERV